MSAEQLEIVAMALKNGFTCREVAEQANVKLSTVLNYRAYKARLAEFDAIARELRGKIHGIPIVPAGGAR